MGVKERRERVKSETRDKILDAARELFTSEGYEGVSMRQVAEKIEYSPTAIYLHFADKEQLFHELVHEDFARLATVFQSAAMPANPVDRIREIGRTYVEFGTHYPNHYKHMLMTPQPPAEGVTRGVSMLLFQDFVFPFELTSILILIAILGALVLAQRGESVPAKGGQQKSS